MITWEQFQEQRKEAQEEVRIAVERRKNNGYRFSAPWLIDSDVLNVVTLWNQIPFTYTTGCCSGTPKDHNSDTWKGAQFFGESFGYVRSHIHPAHPLALDFKNSLQTVEGLEVIVDRVHAGREIDGLQCLKIAFGVPDELVRTNTDLDYLNRCWVRLEEFLTRYQIEKREQLTRI